ncbi:hypothetical protein ACGFR6_35815 [Streptomyces sp. NPDC048567]|uniref:hypothetical protein n=1 Tax=Streptomyces sp. NPDC048567 TaxID=3365570 RepID=UPI003719BC4A
MTTQPLRAERGGPQTAFVVTDVPFKPQLVRTVFRDVTLLHVSRLAAWAAASVTRTVHSLTFHGLMGEMRHADGALVSLRERAKVVREGGVKRFGTVSLVVPGNIVDDYRYLAATSALAPTSGRSGSLPAPSQLGRRHPASSPDGSSAGPSP